MSACSLAPGSVHHWFPAASKLSTTPVPWSLEDIHSCACFQVGVQATRCAPFSSPVSSRSSRSSSTVRDGFNGTRRS